jgi:hypothetical protein
VQIPAAGPDGWQTPAPLHRAVGAGHETGLAPTHWPPRHESVSVHGFPSSHPVPSIFPLQNATDDEALKRKT